VKVVNLLRQCHASVAGDGNIESGLKYLFVFRFALDWFSPHEVDTNDSDHQHGDRPPQIRIASPVWAVCDNPDYCLRDVRQ
jgi:hypothetical protein